MSARAPTKAPTLALSALLFLGTLLLFSRSAGYGFLNYDDPRYVVNNPYIQSGLTWESLRWAFTGTTDLWNPLTRLTHLLDGQLFGTRASGHHWVNSLWQAGNAVLAFLLLRRLTGAFWTSALCAALFAWHPLRVESVAWISERKDVVSVFFGLLTLFAYAAYARRRQQESPHGVGRAYGWTLAAFAAALLSKPSMVALPGVLCLLDFWPLRRLTVGTAASGPASASLRLLVLEKLPFALLAGLFSAITMHTQAITNCFVMTLPLGARVLNAVVSIPRYVGKLLWPFDLAVAYPHPGWWPLWAVLASTVVVAALSFAAWRFRHSAPWLLFGWLWFLGMLVPVIGIVQVGFQSIADRYTFFPTLGVLIAILWSLRALLPRALPRAAIATAAGIALAACVARTWDQQAHWRDSAALFEHAITVTGPNHTAQGFLGYTLAKLGRAEEARQHCEIALAIEPHDQVALYTRAQLLFDAKQYSAAADAFATVLALDPESLDSALGRARALLALQREPEAEALLRPFLEKQPANYLLLQAYSAVALRLGHRIEADHAFRAALAAQPEAPDLLTLHAAYLEATERLEPAVAAYEKAVALDPESPALRLEQARFFARHNRIDEALTAFAATRRLGPKSGLPDFEAAILCLNTSNSDRGFQLLRSAIAAEPGFIPAHIALARLAESSGRSAEADAAWQHAATIAPHDGALECAWAEALARRRDFTGALEHYRRALALNPGEAQAHAGLGYMLLVTGRRAEALAAWEEALRLQPAFPGLAERVHRLKTGR